MQTQKSNMDRYLEFMGLISVMLLSTAAAICPTRCACSKNALKCSGKSLMNVPNLQRLENEPQIIDLSSNEIDFVSYDDFSFDQVDAVRILYLNESKIIDIDDTAFKELSNMIEINLSRNLLGQLPPNAFEYNSKLILVDLSYNLFRIMPRLISSSLETLLLRNSGIEKVKKDTFIQIPNLKYLDLQRNDIKTIDAKIFRDVPKLRLIQLEYNNWKCTCKSVELFNFLQVHSVLNIEEPVQCRSNDDLFVSFFTSEGAPEPIKDICEKNKNHSSSYNFVGNYLEPKEKETFNQRRSAKSYPQNENYETENNIIDTKHSERKLENKSDSRFPSIPFMSVQSYLFIFVGTFSFIFGVVSGYLLVRFRGNRRPNNGSSCDYLLKGNIVV